MRIGINGGGHATDLGAIRAQAAHADAGATDLRATEICANDDDRRRTRALLRSLLR